MKNAVGPGQQMCLPCHAIGPADLNKPSAGMHDGHASSKHTGHECQSLKINASWAVIFILKLFRRKPVSRISMKNKIATWGPLVTERRPLDSIDIPVNESQILLK